MAMVCPSCHTSFEQHLQCPQCNVRLQYQARDGRLPGTALAPEAPRPWQQTPWGRLAVGLLLAQGLYYGLRHLCTAVLLASNEELGRTLWHSLTGLIVLQGLLAAGGLMGGALAGAGQRQGYLYGGLVGVWTGVLYLLIQCLTGQALTLVVVVGQPLLQTAFGVLGGLLGSLIWRPPATLNVDPTAGLRKTTPRAIPLRKPSRLFHGPIAWVRVLAGICVGVAGAVWANAILELIINASERKLILETELEAKLVTWEISILALLAGGALAGATTANGLKQGLAVGMGASTLLLGFNMAKPNSQLHWMLVTSLVVVGVGLLGGWFGGQLFPPLLPSLRRGRRRARHSVP